MKRGKGRTNNYVSQGKGESSLKRGLIETTIPYKNDLHKDPVKWLLTEWRIRQIKEASFRGEESLLPWMGWLPRARPLRSLSSTTSERVRWMRLALDWLTNRKIEKVMLADSNYTGLNPCLSSPQSTSQKNRQNQTQSLSLWLTQGNWKKPRELQIEYVH